MSTKNYPIIGTKSSILWDEETDAWVYISGRPVGDENPRAYYKTIPTLYRAVDIRASAIANLPWALMRGETEFESSDNYENKTGLVSSMTNMLYLIEASLTLSGVAYWKREKNVAGFDKLRHLDPTSMNLDEKRAQKGELVWKRNENGVPKEYTPEDIIYLWYPDPFVEIGPPSSWPVKSALNACGVLANLDEFAKSYFGRGAIKAMIFGMQGASKDTAEEFEKWWEKYVTGIKNAFKTKVINAEKVAPVIVGEGIKELENVTLTQEKREEIAYACGIPLSLLFSNTANFAEANEQKHTWYDEKIVPESKFIADVLNDQIFIPIGLRLKFLPETLDIFQEDERERSEAMSRFVDAIVKAKTLELAQAMFLIYGVEVPDEAMGLIEAHFQKKEEMADEFRERQEQAPPQQPPQTQPTQPPQLQAENVRSIDYQQIGHELTRWRDKCLSAVKRGQSADSVDFIPVAIPADVFDRVTVKLVGLQDEQDIRDVFMRALRDEPEDSLYILATELRRANDLLAVASAT